MFDVRYSKYFRLRLYATSSVKSSEVNIEIDINLKWG